MFRYLIDFPFVERPAQRHYFILFCFVFRSPVVTFFVRFIVLIYSKTYSSLRCTCLVGFGLLVVFRVRIM